MKKLLTLACLLCTAVTTSAQVTFTATGQSIGDASKLFDGIANNNNNKWQGTWNSGPHYALFEASAAIYVNGITITTAADDASYASRSIREWELYGSNTEAAKTNAGDASWEQIQRVFYQMPSTNATEVKFPFNPSQTAYKYYKFVVTKLSGGNHMQVGELAFDYSTVPQSQIQAVANGGENKTDSHDERAIKVFDGMSSTKWYYGSNTNFIVFRTPKPVSLKTYVIQTANDSNDRDPKTFKLYGAHVVAPTTDGSIDGWIQIDSKTDASSSIPVDRYAYAKFKVDSPDDYYQYFMLKIDATRNNYNAMQMSEFIMYDYEEQNPVIISSAADMEGFATRVNNGETSLGAKVTANIDMSDVTHTPIGTSSNKYAGTFDGQEHVIENLSLSASSGSGVGFFGYANSATIQDVEFLKANVNVTGGQNTGVVVGICDNNTTIQRCAVVNSYLNGSDHTGSIAGCAKGNSTISNCYSNAKVTSNTQAGGMVGTSEGMTLEHCLFMGPSIEGTYSSHGGARGLISLLEGGSTTMKHNVVATQYVYSGGGSNYCQSLVSQNGKTLDVDDNFSWTTTRYGNASSNQTYGLNSNDVNGQQIAPGNVNQSFFEARGFDLTNVWKMVEDYTYAGGSYPVLKWMSIPASVEISTSKELTDFSTFMWDNQNATLTQDIVADENYTPMGNEFRYYYGTFDGLGHDVTLALTGNTFQGLFGCAKDNAVFRNIVIKGSVSGTGNCAALIGEVKGNHGTITISRVGCEANVTSTGGYNGAFVGNNWGGTIRLVVENSYNIGDIEGSSNTAVMGGYAKNTSTYTNVYNKGTITGGSYPFVHNNEGVFTNCYTTSTESTAISGLTQKISADMITSGELCYKLGAAFTQDLSQANSYPTFGSETVGGGQWFSDDYIYYNIDESDNITVNELNLDENNTKYEVPAKVTAKSVTLTRNLKNDRWNTFCVPFAMTGSQITEQFGSGSQVKELSGAEQNGENYTMSFTNADAIVAGKPYMVKPANNVSSIELTNASGIAVNTTGTPSVTQDGVTFTGVYANGNAPRESFIISNNNFYKVDSDDVTLKAFRGYITVAGAGAGIKALSYVFDDEADGIVSPFVETEEGAIYNLAGQRISKMQKGINIVNGKKMLIGK